MHCGALNEAVAAPFRQSRGYIAGFGRTIWYWFDGGVVQAPRCKGTGVMGAEVEQVVSLLRRRIPGLVAIYRFGSSGTPAEHARSDLDLAVLTEPPLAKDARALLRWKIAEEVAFVVRRDVDLVDLGSASIVLRARVISGGRRLWCADEAYAERFEDYAFSAYARLNEERSGILRDIRDRGRIHG